MDFNSQLRRQLGFVRRSCLMYDAGEKDEAIRIATSLRVIFHQTDASTSLVNHLGSPPFDVKSSVHGEQSIRIVPGGQVSISTHLVKLRLNESPSVQWYFDPMLGKASQADVSRQQWWEGEVVLTLMGKDYNRKEIVRGAANKDGGCHVAVELPPDYQAILDAGPISSIVNSFSPTSTLTVEGLHLALLRQIGHELLESPSVFGAA